MDPLAIAQLQIQLGIPATAVMDSATIKAMEKAVSAAVSKNKDVQKYAGSNDVNSILNAYTTGDWSGVVSLTGKPFTDEQQKVAVAEAEKVLGPAYEAGKSFDTSIVADKLAAEQEGFAQFQKDEKKDFGVNKDTLDQSAADNGVLFSGSRFQKLNDLRTTYQDRERIARQQSASRTRSTARDYQYDYGNGAANKLSSMYRLPGESGFNANVAGGKVTSNPTLSSTYSPNEFNFQGTKPVAQQAAVQTRAAGQLANRANKLSLSGFGVKY